MNFFSGKPSTAFSFYLRVEFMYDVPLKSVQAFSKQNKYEYIQEGGLNDYVHLKRKPNTEMFTFKVERYVSKVLTDPLANGEELIAPVFLSVYDNSGGEESRTRTYMFIGCKVVGKDYGGMDAEKSGLYTETVTIAYNEVYIV